VLPALERADMCRSTNPTLVSLATNDPESLVAAALFAGHLPLVSSSPAIRAAIGRRENQDVMTPALRIAFLLQPEIIVSVQGRFGFPFTSGREVNCGVSAV